MPRFVLAADLRMAAPLRAVAVELLARPLKYEQRMAERGYDEVLAATSERGALPGQGLPLFWSILTTAGEVPGSLPETRFFDGTFVDTLDAWAPR